MITKIFFQVSSTPYFCQRKTFTRNSFFLPYLCVCFILRWVNMFYTPVLCKLGFVISNMIKDFDPLVSSVKGSLSIFIYFFLTLSVSLSSTFCQFHYFYNYITWNRIKQIYQKHKTIIVTCLFFNGTLCLSSPHTTITTTLHLSPMSTHPASWCTVRSPPQHFLLDSHYH